MKPTSNRCLCLLTNHHRSGSVEADLLRHMISRSRMLFDPDFMIETSVFSSQS